MPANNPLDDISKIANIANFYQLEKVRGELQRISRFTEDAAIHQSNQKKLRQHIFDIRTAVDNKIQTLQNDLVKNVFLLKLKYEIASTNLTPSSFDEIADKQYFLDTIKIIDNHLLNLSSDQNIAKDIWQKVYEINTKASISVKILNYLNSGLLVNTNYLYPKSFLFGIIFLIVFFIVFVFLSPESLAGESSLTIIIILTVLSFILGYKLAFNIKEPNFLVDEILRDLNCGLFVNENYAKALIPLVSCVKKNNAESKIQQIMASQSTVFFEELNAIYEKYPELKNIW